MKIMEIEFIKNLGDRWYGQPEWVRKIELIVGMILTLVILFWPVNSANGYAPILFYVLFFGIIPGGLLAFFVAGLWKLATFLIEELGL
jgi:hypothetical protein